MQGQQTALGSRLESLTQAADNAMEREREAEDRLDAALTQHARQISHRQARESELERTIQELNAALVAKTRQGQSNSMDKKTSDSSTDQSSAKLANVQHELDTAVAHLALERERVRFFLFTFCLFTSPSVLSFVFPLQSRARPCTSSYVKCRKKAPKKHLLSMQNKPSMNERSRSLS